MKPSSNGPHPRINELASWIVIIRAQHISDAEGRAQAVQELKNRGLWGWFTPEQRERMDAVEPPDPSKPSRFPLNPAD